MVGTSTDLVHNDREGLLTPTALARPRHGADCATLGDIIRVHRTTASHALRDAMHTLRAVRNALAHGHPVGWQAARRLTRASTVIYRGR